MAATSPFPDVVVVMSGHLHLTASQVAGGGFRAVRSAFPKMIGLGVYTNLGKALFSKKSVWAVSVKTPASC